MRIALGSFTQNAHCERIANGVIEELHQLRNKYPMADIDVFEYRNLHRFYSDLKEVKFDGAILYCNQFPLYYGLPKLQLRPFTEFNIPWINTSNRYSNMNTATTVPRIVQDDEAIGLMAARFLLNKGVETFAYAGFTEDFEFSRQRRMAFTAHLEQQSKQVYTVPAELIPMESNQPADMKGLQLWLRSLPTGTAVFAANDEVGDLILLAAREAGIAVPRVLSVLGVDNSNRGNWGRLALSSIETNAGSIGRVAMKSIFSWLANGHHPPAADSDRSLAGH
ncbi:MAG: substrate-binding domain-containing protein [Verrucomicrobia bacterium]|nr:substrate-binding domain-containing protein [Verrucomicrobiota bacterium]